MTTTTVDVMVDPLTTFEATYGHRLCVNGVHTAACEECNNVNLWRYLAGQIDGYLLMCDWFAQRGTTKRINESSPPSTTLKTVTGKYVPNVVVILAAQTMGVRMSITPQRDG
jgi:hypothetical protein